MRQAAKEKVFDYNFRTMKSLSRRDFLKLGGLSLGSLAFTPALTNSFDFDDSDLVRVATKSVSIYSRPTDKSSIVSTWFRDELLRVYEEVTADEPVLNPIWYRVWGGFVHRSHLQRVKILYNETLTSLGLDEGLRR
ncbi:MAG TPA: twin-arginine translocation signal domain-containing protein, partial [Methanosarcina sp.]|nr:twin-arginine translocation signal domain-containing protein [Methanosarcina sp.]